MSIRGAKLCRRCVELVAVYEAVAELSILI